MSAEAAPAGGDTEAPTDEAVAEKLGVDVRELRGFVDAFGDEGPTVAAVLGWATAAPGAIALVEEWLAAREREGGR